MNWLIVATLIGLLLCLVSNIYLAIHLHQVNEDIVEIRRLWLARQFHKASHGLRIFDPHSPGSSTHGGDHEQA